MMRASIRCTLVLCLDALVLGSSREKVAQDVCPGGSCSEEGDGESVLVQLGRRLQERSAKAALPGAGLVQVLDKSIVGKSL